MIPRGIEALAGQHIQEARRGTQSQNAAHLNELERSRIHYNHVNPIIIFRRVVRRLLPAARRSADTITTQQFVSETKFSAPSEASLNNSSLLNETFEEIAKDLGDVAKRGSRIIFKSKK